MKQGFTFIEVMVIIIIFGILAIFGVGQYSRFIEKQHGTEAKGILPLIRHNAQLFRIDTGSLAGFNNAMAGIGTLPDQAPSACTPTHYFRYSMNSSDPNITITATRCGSGGKSPQGETDAGTTLELVSNLDLATDTDTWGGTGFYYP